MAPAKKVVIHKQIKETNMPQTVNTRTQRMNCRQYNATDPATFASILIEKLEKVKREQESQALLNRKLMEEDSMASLDEKARLSSMQLTEPANATREKLQLEDDNDQDILDQHVSRVFSDLTLSRSSGFVSPRPYSSSRNRWGQDPYLLPRRKDKDGFSMFSSDSGNVHDFPEGFDHKMTMVKSKSMTDYSKKKDKFVRGMSSRRSSSKKTLSEFTDSGVSVVSETPPVTHAVKDNRVLAGVMESNRSGQGIGHTYSEMSSKHSLHRKAYKGSRSSSMERNSSSLGPAQPFVADPSMPPLPIPNTAIQLQEARRRLEDDVHTTRFRQKSSNNYFPDMTQSSQSTLRRSTRGKLAPLPTATMPEEYTTAVYSFCDEQVPYLTKIPGQQITSNKFKEYLPKRGNYRVVIHKQIKETNMPQTVNTRTQRMNCRQYNATDPATFASILIEKLEKVKREQESQALLNRKLMEEDSMASLDEKARLSSMQLTEPANATREKLQLEDDNDQDILDQHVSRVFSDLTLSRSSGFVSPRPYSSSRNRWGQDPYLLPRRKDKDGFSMFSSDSGNVHDFPEGFDHKMTMVKSKSMTDYSKKKDKFVRGMSSRRSSSKKTLSEFTDSGVSVVSETPPVTHAVKDNRVLAGVMESNRSGQGIGHTYSEMSSKHSLHRKAYKGSRSSSMERNSSSLGPAQPFVADPSMPPLPIPNTAIQLQEARRRLEDDVHTTRFRQKSSNKYFPDMTQSSQSTLRRSTRGKLAPLPTATMPEEYTTAAYSFCDEQVPYLTKIPGQQITLNKFKEYLPKRGNYRFYFKTECEELSNQVILEEISNGADVVPLFEGNIMAQVKPSD